jgi:hypothetical protein
MTIHRWVLGVTFLAGLLGACSVSACSAASNQQFGTRGGSGGAGSGSGSGAGTVGSTGAGGAGFDAGMNGDGSSTPSCQYVDILFLIDNSASMSPKQAKLAQAWPQFVDAIYATLPAGIDLHVGMTSTSFYVGSTSESTINCMSGNAPADVAAHFIPPGMMNDGENGGQGRLYQYMGKSYYSAITPMDKAGFTSWFAGAATAIGQVGSSYEFPSAGIAYTTDPANAQANAGFFRDADGVLVLIFLTDEPDKSYDVEPNAKHYHDMIVSEKQKCGGDPCVVTAGLIDACIPPSNQFLWQFMTSFGVPMPPWTDINGTVAAYNTVIGDSLAQVVKKTCDTIATK